MSLGYSRFKTLRSLLAETATIAVLTLTQATLAVAKTPQEIAQIAVPITVQINDNAGGGGSGVIIARSGHSYSVLTVNHVVQRPDLTYTISTDAGKTYPVVRVQRLQGSENDPDLAIVTFDSPEHYPVARLGNSTQAAIGSNVYVSGYPAPGWQHVQRDYEFSPGTITSRLQSAPQGYTLRYNADTVSGMSGSPVFDAKGRVIGIHGEGETVGTAQSESGGAIPIKTGFNAGIPINTFVALRAPTQLVGSEVKDNSHSARPTRISHLIDARHNAHGLPRPNAPVSRNALADYNRGNVLSYKDNEQKAIRNYTQAIRLSPKNAFAYYNRAETRYHLGDKQGAIKDYLRAIQFSPRFALAYNNLGMVRHELGDKQGAIRDYTQAVRFSPMFALAYNNLGMARYELGDKQGAIRDYTQAVRFLPNYAIAYYNRGVARHQIGDKEGALRDYTQAIQLSHDYSLAYYNRGVIHSDLGKNQAALEDFQQAANIYQEEGNTDKYQYVLARIRELRPTR